MSNSDYLRTFERFLGNFDASDPGCLTISTHDRWVSVHPAVLTMAAALGSKVGPENIVVESISAASGHYLDRMGLFEVLGQESPFKITRHEPSGRFIPLSQIRTAEEQTRFITDMIPLLHLEPNQSDAIKYVVGEMVRNVLEHAASTTGAFVAAQYYLKSNMVRIGIADAGIGIRESISQSWPVSTDAEAIVEALKPGVTGTTRREGGTDANAGAGLFFIKSMAMVARNYFVLYSGSGLFKLLKRDLRIKGFPRLHSDPRRDMHSLSNDNPRFEGTVVAMDISLDQTQEFRVMLSAIRESYTKAVRERKAARNKAPRFT